MSNNTYLCFYKSRKIEVTAESSYAAQKKAAEHFKTGEKKRCEISVVLASVDGRSVSVHPAQLP